MLFIRSIYQDNSKVHINHEGNALRVAYMLADIVIASGNTYLSIDCEDTFLPNLSDRYKRKTIEICCEKLNPPYPLADFQKFFKDYQGIKAIKHKNKEALLLERNYLKHFESLYAACKTLITYSLSSSGLPLLMPLYESDEIYLHGHTTSDPESSEDKAMPMSEMLLEKWTGDDELYIVTHPFGDFLKERTDGLPDSEADELLWSLSLGKLPVLTHFTAPELRLVKEQVFGGAAAMRKNIEDWSAGLKGKQYSALRTEEFESFFNRDILPFKIEWEERKQECELLNQMDSFHRGQAGTEIMFCLAAAKTLWDYWVWSGSVAEVSMDKFRAALPEGCTEDSPVPFIICNTFDKLDNVYEQGDKKSLEL